MATGDDPSVSVMLFSAENPDATYLTAGLLHTRHPRFTPITLQNIDLPIIAEVVTLALEEIGISFGRWRPRVVDREKGFTGRCRHHFVCAHLNDVTRGQGRRSASGVVRGEPARYPA